MLSCPFYVVTPYWAAVQELNTTQGVTRQAKAVAGGRDHSRRTAPQPLSEVLRRMRCSGGRVGAAWLQTARSSTSVSGPGACRCSG